MSKESWDDVVTRVKQIDLKWLLLFCLIVTAFIAYKVFQTERTLISLSTIALMLGLVFESLRLGGFRKEIMRELLLAYACSFIVFIPMRFEEYGLMSRISTWPAVFIGAYVIFSVILFKDRIIPKINLTHTFVCLLAFVYYAYEWDWFWDESWLYRCLAFSGLLSTLFVLFLSLRKGVLTQRIRLMLSVFSALLMIFFAAEFAIELFVSTKYAREITWLEKLDLFFPYFVLGMGLVYTMQNIYLIIDFNYFGDGDHVEHARSVATVHLNRYDPVKPILLRFLAIVSLVLAVFWLIIFLIS
jgi:hypothetical protein